MSQLVPSIQFTISGFVYLAFLFFTILTLIRKYEINLSKIPREYLPFLAILVVFLSYVLGYTAYLSSQLFIFWIYPSYNNQITIV